MRDQSTVPRTLMCNSCLPITKNARVVAILPSGACFPHAVVFHGFSVRKPEPEARVVADAKNLVIRYNKIGTKLCHIHRVRWIVSRTLSWAGMEMVVDQACPECVIEPDRTVRSPVAIFVATQEWRAKQPNAWLS